ncbi:hypothetical protein EDE04_2968 [Streptomyces sp. 2132.2]|uniref:hypothetical protein n=1 Tax=Streptomyces TaxID=1883 RepID=UPI000C18ABEA|nr:hypothetical protein [Streptomyces sp. 2132.2]ROQ96505.1 hypothetical protein EDE04_2968 [Streptomyces sp. 2132.2]
MSLAVVLLTVGSVCFAAGGAVALNVRGSATALERWGESNAELARHARGDLGPAARVASARFYQYLATVIALGGVVFALCGLAELG